MTILSWVESDTHALFLAENFRTEPADLVNLGQVNEQNIDLVFIIGVIFVFPDLFPEIHLHRATGTFMFSICILNLSAIELTPEIDNVIITRALENGLADERSKLPHTEIHPLLDARIFLFRQRVDDDHM